VPTIVIRRDGGADPLGGDPAEGPSISAAAPVITPDAPPPPPSPALMRALEKMREVFRLRDLRPGQAEIIESVLAGRDTLAVMPTGSGKSLTYQLPALVLDGPTIVVSPLLALIEDQFTKLKAAGYHHAFIQEPDRELICLNGIAVSCGDLTRVLDTKSAT